MRSACVLCVVQLSVILGRAKHGKELHPKRPAWVGKVPAGVCYEHVSQEWREMVVFQRDAGDGLLRCQSSAGGGAAAAPVPVVVAVHGFGGGYPDMFVPLVAPVVVEAGLALAVPRGVNGSWNGHYCCGDAAKRNIDDLGALRRLLVLCGR